MRITSRFAPLGWAILLTAIVCPQALSAPAGNGNTAKARKPPSVCVGLDESVCGSKAECYWRKATLTKSGKTRRAHCRIKRSASRTPPA